MAQTHIPVSSGIALIQAYEAGENPGAATETIYTAAKWSFSPGVRYEYVKGPRGVDMIAVPVAIDEQMVTLDFIEAPVRVQAYRLNGNVTFLAANTSLAVRFIAARQYNGGLASVSAIRTAINGLSAATNAAPGLYKATFAGAATPVLRKISPVPETIAVQTTVLTAALSATTYTPASPPASSGGDVFFTINSAIDGGFTVDYDRPRAWLHHVECFSDIELGNAFVHLSASSCIPADSSLDMERGALSAMSQTYRILGGDVEIGQFNYSRELDGPAGIV